MILVNIPSVSSEEDTSVSQVTLSPPPCTVRVKCVTGGGTHIKWTGLLIEPLIGMNTLFFCGRGLNPFHPKRYQFESITLT